MNLRKTFITAYDFHRNQPLFTDNIRYQGFPLCPISFPYRDLGVNAALDAVGLKAGETESVHIKGSEAQGAVRDPWSKAGSGEELAATFPARTGNAHDGGGQLGGQVCLLGRARALVRQRTGRSSQGLAPGGAGTPPPL
jgi:hypothetical protein